MRSQLQKGVLVLFGIFLSGVLMELMLRAGGWVVLSMQEARNRFSLRRQGAYRVLCLGESTTANQYPRFLEASLNRQPGLGVAFSVIDKGVPGTSTSWIVQQLEVYLDQYHPDVVVTMMGVNDQLRFSSSPAPRLPRALRGLTGLRMYKVACWVWSALEATGKGARPSRASEADVVRSNVTSAMDAPLVFLNAGWHAISQDRFAEAQQDFEAALALNPRNDAALTGLGRAALKQAQFAEAQQDFEAALALNPRNDATFIGLGWLALYRGRFEEAQDLFYTALELNPRNDTAFTCLGELATHQGRFREADDLFRAALALNPRNDRAFLYLGRAISKQGRFQEAVDFFRTALVLNAHNTVARKELATMYFFTGWLVAAARVLTEAPEHETNYFLLARISDEMGDGRLGQAYQRKANDLGLDQYPFHTRRDYLQLTRMLDQRRIMYVCVQYPMRSVEPLKELLAGAGKIFFVENGTSFRHAVAQEGYQAYFKDAFGGDFGHCTEKGNRLLAQNIARVILSEVRGQLAQRP